MPDNMIELLQIQFFILHKIPRFQHFILISFNHPLKVTPDLNVYINILQ